MSKELEKNPWVTKSREEVYDNPWIKVEEHQVINPSGGDGIYGVVSFKNIAIAIVPLDEEMNTWLVGQYRYTMGAYSWEIPEGGCLKESESILEAAKRELLEETGMEASKWTNIQKMALSNSVSDEIGYTFIAQGLTMGAAKPEETEELQVKKIPFEEALEMCLNGEITDALTMVSLFKIKILLDRGML